jgi:hypothetical protein
LKPSGKYYKDRTQVGTSWRIKKPFEKNIREKMPEA